MSGERASQPEGRREWKIDAASAREGMRPLSAEDTEACAALARAEGWQADLGRWRMMLELAEGLGVELDRDAGGLVATVLLNRFAPGVAVVGMMLVRADQRRRGWGRRLMERALDRAAGSVVYLYASDLGEPLYVRLGFQTAGASVRWKGAAALPPSALPAGVRPARSEDLPAIVALDEEAQGASRRPLLAALLAGAASALMVEGEGGLAGFGIASVIDGARVLGPVVSRQEEQAAALAGALAAGSVEPLILDVPDGASALQDWAGWVGLRREGTTPLMVHQGAPLPGRRELNRALAGRAFG